MSLLNTVDTALGAGFTLQLLAVPGFFNEMYFGNPGDERTQTWTQFAGVFLGGLRALKYVVDNGSDEATKKAAVGVTAAVWGACTVLSIRDRHMYTDMWYPNTGLQVVMTCLFVKEYLA